MHVDHWSDVVTSFFFFEIFVAVGIVRVRFGFGECNRTLACSMRISINAMTFALNLSRTTRQNGAENQKKFSGFLDFFFFLIYRKEVRSLLKKFEISKSRKN